MPSLLLPLCLVAMTISSGSQHHFLDPKPVSSQQAQFFHGEGVAKHRALTEGLAVVGLCCNLKPGLGACHGRTAIPTNGSCVSGARVPCQMEDTERWLGGHGILRPTWIIPREQRCLPTRRVFSTTLWEHAVFLKAFAERRQWNFALCLLTRMPTRRCRPDLVCFRTAADGCCRAAVWAVALALLQSTKSVPVPMDQVSMKSAIRAWRASGWWSRAQHLLDGLRQVLLKLDTMAYNTVMDVHAASDQWQRAMRLHRSIIEQALEPSEVSYNSCCRSFAGAAIWTLALVHEAKRQSTCVGMDAIGLNTLLDVLAAEGLWSRSLHKLCAARSRKLQDTVGYNSVSLAAVAARWSAALQLLPALKTTCLVPDAFTFSFGTRASQSWRAAFVLIQEAQEARAWVDAIIYDGGFRACRQGE